MAKTPTSTPKRKHSQLLNDTVPNLNTITQFTFDSRSPDKDGSASPRSRVAHRFRGLALEGGGGVTNGGGGRTSLSPEPKPTRHAFFLSMQDEAMGGDRKRVKLPDLEMSDAHASPLQPAATIRDDDALVGFRTDMQPVALQIGCQSPRQKSPRSVRFADSTIVEKSGPNVTGGSSPTQDATKADEDRPASRARAGTPPLAYRAGGLDSKHGNDEPYISDPLRASLTWHDDEITIYDPDDSDDDGIGINGIGFKPTPAIAYARTVKRRQQLADYRKREEREARAKRSQRRRSSPVPGLVELKGTVERRRVRFMESATELISF